MCREVVRDFCAAMILVGLTLNTWSCPLLIYKTASVNIKLSTTDANIT